MIPSFLDPKMHPDPTVPRDFLSVHYYSGSGGITGDAFATDFFEGSDGFIEEMRRNFNAILRRIVIPLGSF